MRTRLTPKDRFSIGGRYIVRGFDGETILSAERGSWMHDELGLSLTDNGQEAYIGLDYGQMGGPGSDLLVGKQWQKCCASGNGIYFNCNRKKKGYKFLGVGMINYYSYEKRWNFINKALAYLAKKDQYLLSKVTKNMRCMGHGEAPDKSGFVRQGRPRSISTGL